MKRVDLLRISMHLKIGPDEKNFERHQKCLITYGGQFIEILTPLP